MRLKTLLAAASLLAICAAGTANANTVALPTTVAGYSGSWSGPGYVYDPTGVTNVSFTGQGGLAMARSPFFGPVTPNNEVGIMLQSGNTAALKVTGIGGAGEANINLNGQPTGNVTLTFYDIARINYAADSYKVLYNGTVLATDAPTSSSSWTKQTLTFNNQGGTLSFLATTNVGVDGNVSISDISLNAINGGIGATPELSSSLMMSFGILGFGFMAWRRRETEA